MLQMAFVSGCTAALAVVGFSMGHTVHGLSPATLVTTLAGAAGGFGIGCASLDVLRRWRAARANAQAGTGQGTSPLA